MARPRVLPRSLVAALILMLAMAGPALGVSGNASGNGGTKELCSRGFCMDVNFGARWTTYTFKNSHGSWRVFDDIEMTAAAIGGKNCTFPACVSWSFGARAWIYNSSGQLMKFVSDPPEDACFDHAYASTTRMFWRCETSAFQLSTAARTIKFQWTLAVTSCCGDVTTVTTTRTFPVSGQ